MSIKRLLDIKDILALNLGGRTTIWKKVKDGSFPKPIKLGSSQQAPLRWRQKDIEIYLNNL
jgi:predicted DNA-binding transcriptional regulator AlpA